MAARPDLAFHQDLDRTVGQLEHLHNLAEGAELIEIFDLGIVGLRVALRDQKDLPFIFHGPFQGLDGTRPAHEQGRHHVRENHDIPQREHRKPFRLIVFTDEIFEIFCHIPSDAVR